MHRIIRATDAETVQMPGQTFWVYDRAMPLTFMPYRLESGSGVPIHRHQNAQEQCLVQTGRVKFVVEGEEVIAEPGDYLHIPRGVSHGFVNIGDEPAQMIWLSDAGAFEKFCIAMDELIAEGADQERFAAVAAEHDVEFVGGVPEK